MFEDTVHIDYKVTHHVVDLGWLWFWLFHYLPDSAWANEIGRLGRAGGPDEWNIQARVNPTQVRDVMGHPVHWQYWNHLQLEKWNWKQ